MTTVRIDKEGMLTIPPALLERLGATSGGELTVELDVAGRLILTPLPLPAAVAAPSFADSVRCKNLSSSIQHIKGVGPKLVEAFQRLGVTTVEDALYLLPHRYEDRRELRTEHAARGE